MTTYVMRDFICAPPQGFVEFMVKYGADHSMGMLVKNVEADPSCVPCVRFQSEMEAFRSSSPSAEVAAYALSTKSAQLIIDHLDSAHYCHPLQLLLDLCVVRPNGTVLFGTITSEDDAWLEVSEAEFDSLTLSLPDLPLLAPERVDTSRRALTDHEIALVNKLLDGCAAGEALLKQLDACKVRTLGRDLSLEFFRQVRR